MVRRFEFAPGADVFLNMLEVKARTHYARAIHRDAVRFCPVAPPLGAKPPHPGHLKRSIKLEHGYDASYIGADVEYAAAQELGARPHAIPNAFGFGEDFGREPDFHPGNAPQPYLRPALYAVREGRLTSLVPEADHPDRNTFDTRRIATEFGYRTEPNE